MASEKQTVRRMEVGAGIYAQGDSEGIKALEKELLAQNAQHKDWCCTEERMKTTRDGKALYLHCLPADINDVSCVDGEVEASVFDRYRDPLYKEASFKPYIIAAMIFLAKVKDPQATLKALEERGLARWFQKQKKYEEIALEFGISINTVKYHIKNALSLLQKRLDNYLHAT